MGGERGNTMQVEDTTSELELKVLLVGAPESGKTSLVRRLCDKSFREEYVQTLGFDITVVPYGVYQGRPVKIHLWDVAGSQLKAQPSHHALIGQGADGVLYVMDVTSRESLQAVDDWDQALSKFLPPRACKLLVGHKADLPAYVVNDEALSLYVAGASGFMGWCLTVGSSEYGDYDVAARRGGGGSRYKGQSLSGEKQLSVSEAMRTLLGHIFRSGGAGGSAVRPAGVLGLGASAGRVTPLPSDNLQDALQTLELLGLGGTKTALKSSRADVDTEKNGAVDEDGRGWGSQESSGDRSGQRSEERGVGSTGMEALLQRGRGPGSGWRVVRGGGNSGDSNAGGDGGVGHQAESDDPGWRFYAGRMGREEAEALLSGRPDGTFFLRRKAPSLLVLTYVALSKRPHSSTTASTPGSGRKARRSPLPSRSPPRRDLHGSPRGDGLRRGASVGSGLGEPSGGTSVQHALLVHDGGFFSDERGRLGRFATIHELLKSKISALARYPLSFRRERDRYVLVDNDEGHPAATSATSAQQSTSSNPFSKADPDGLMVHGTTASSLAPAITGDLFGAGTTRGETGRAPSTRSTAVSSPPLSPPPPTGRSLSPRPNGANPFEQAPRSWRSNSTARSNLAGGDRGADWTDKRINSGGARGAGEAGAPSDRGAISSSAGGSLWMEAAAAVEKSGAATVRPGKSGRAGGTVKAPGRPRSGSLPSPGGEAVATESLQELKRTTTSAEGIGSARATLRRRERQGSVSSADGGSALSSPSSQPDSFGARSSKFPRKQHEQRRRVGGGRETASAMAEAAEAAAAMSAARGHPDARHVEKRAIAVQATVDRALVRLEEQLRPLVSRKTPVHSPLWQSPKQSPASSASSAEKHGVRRFSASPPRPPPPPSSVFSSPRDSPRSPRVFSPSPLGRDRHQHHQHEPQWVPAAPEGSGTAPLVAAAALLMERASSRREELVSSVHMLHERAVALAVSERSADSRSDTAAKSPRAGGARPGSDGVALGSQVAGFVPIPSHSSGGVDPASTALSPVRGAGNLPLPVPPGFAVAGSGGGGESDDVLTEGPTGKASADSNVVGTDAAMRSSPPLNGEHQRRWEGERPTVTAAVAPIAGGVAGVSCCRDFERILGDGLEAGLPGKMAPFGRTGDQELTRTGSSISREELYADKGAPLSDSSVLAERSFSGVDQQSLGGMTGGPVLPSLREERRSGHLLPMKGDVPSPGFRSAEDEWPAVFRDVATAEEDCRELLDVWEAAGAALEDACVDVETTQPRPK